MHNTKKKEIILLTIILLLISFNVVYCMRYDDPVIASRFSSDDSSGVVTPSVVTSSGGTSSSKSSTGGGHTQTSSTPTIINFDAPGDQLEYRKFSTNWANNELRRVYVEIYSKSDKPIELNIREFVDPNICIALPSIHGYVLSSMDEISLYELGILGSLELQDNINVLNYNKDYIILKYDNYNISLDKSNLVEINAPQDFASESYKIQNNLVFFNWTSCKDKNLTYYPDFENYLEHLGIISKSDGKYIRFDSDNDNIQIINNNSIIAKITKNKNVLDKNSILLKYTNSTYHLKYSNANDQPIYNNKFLSLNEVTIPPGSMFVFWYDLKANRGSYCNAVTVLKSIIPGLIKPTYIPLSINNNLNISVISRIYQSKIFLSEYLPIEFELRYLGGGPTDIRIPIDFPTSEGDYKYVLKENGTSDLNKSFSCNLSVNSSISIKKFIKFSHTGVQLTPVIIVDNKKFDTSMYIPVDSKFSRDPLLFSQISLLALTLILFILSNIFLYKEDQKENLKNKLKTWREKNIIFRHIGLNAIFIIILIVIYIIYEWANR